MRFAPLMLIALLATARADVGQPWATGVTASQRATAQQRLEAGNALFLDRKYAEALEEYKQAVAAWDHPAIRFNIVRCLIQLDRAVEAAENLKLALKYGSAPLEDTVYQEALAYDKLLANEIGDLEVSCAQPGVRVTFDGQPLATCPAKESRRVAPGPHQLVGTRDGLLTSTIEVIVIGGKHQDVHVSLKPLEQAARIEHRWPTWMPWVVFGGGFAVVAIGGIVELQASTNLGNFDQMVQHDCPNNCPAGTVSTGERSRGELENKIAVSVLTVGVATIATGVAMLYMNRGRTVYPHSIERVVDFTPLHGGGALTLRGRF